MEETKVFPTVTLDDYGITLRELRASDAPLITIACNDPEIQRWLPLPSPYTVEHAEWYIREFANKAQSSGRGIVFAIEVKNNFIGCIDIKRAEWLNGNCEIGYWVALEQRGFGYMSLALDLLSRWVLREQGFCRVEVRAAAENMASQRVAIKAGFIREGIARKAGRVHDGRVDLVIFSRVQDDI